MNTTFHVLAMRDVVRHMCLGLGVAAVVFAGGAQARADSLLELLERTVESHDRIESARQTVTAAQARAEAAVKDWFPTFDANGSFGHERINNPSSADTQLTFSTLDLSLTQLLWDFGATNTAVERARLDLLDAELRLVAARQDLILEGAQAYVNLVRASDVLGYARQSEENIRKQTELEDARVETGSGLSTDVLQAKTQLAGAEARRIQSEGALISARNRFRAVFDDIIPDLEDLDPVELPVAWLPPDLGSAMSIALETNTDLALANVAETISRADVDSTRQSEFYPTLNGTIERNTGFNESGTLGNKEETVAKIELTYSLNVAGKGLDSLRASQADLAAQTATVLDTRTTTEEAVRNEWSALNIARSTANSLNTQAEIAKAFLDLAREERQLGKRSLIDVLSGETAYINALSDAASAETDVLLAAFSMLRSLGKLDYPVFSEPDGPKTLQDLDAVSQRPGAASGFAPASFADQQVVQLSALSIPAPIPAAPAAVDTAVSDPTGPAVWDAVDDGIDPTGPMPEIQVAAVTEPLAEAPAGEPEALGDGVLSTDNVSRVRAQLARRESLQSALRSLDARQRAAGRSGPSAAQADSVSTVPSRYQKPVGGPDVAAARDGDARQTPAPRAVPVAPVLVAAAPAVSPAAVDIDTADSAFFVGRASDVTVSAVETAETDDGPIEVAAVDARHLPDPGAEPVVPNIDDVRAPVAPESAARPVTDGGVPSYSLDDVFSWFDNGSPANDDAADTTAQKPVASPPVDDPIDAEAQRAEAADARGTVAASGEAEWQNPFAAFVEALSSLFQGSADAPRAAMESPSETEVRQASEPTVAVTVTDTADAAESDGDGVPEYTLDEFAALFGGLF